MLEKSRQTRDRILNSAEPLIMAQGFAGTSIDEILKKTGLTKGAFFHHFKGKNDLARALVERHTRRNMAMFEQFAAQAEAKSAEPLEQTLLFLEAFENYVDNLTDQPSGCIYAAYTYESLQFDPSIIDFVGDALRKWTSIYVRKFQHVLDRYDPALPVTARQLGEMIVSIVEGGLMLQRAYGDARLTSRQSEQFRNYLELLFGGRKGKSRSKTASPAVARRAGAKARA
jgi:TetR/AcrR family transcriptional repressor of nem operon